MDVLLCFILKIQGSHLDNLVIWLYYGKKAKVVLWLKSIVCSSGLGCLCFFFFSFAFRKICYGSRFLKFLRCVKAGNPDRNRREPVFLSPSAVFRFR